MNNNEILVSLDIGTSAIKVIIGEMVNDSLNVIGVGNVKSKGIRKGAVVDIDDTVHSIKKAIEQAERMVGVEISTVIVGIAANHAVLHPCNGVVAVSSENREITSEDVIRVKDAAQVMSIPPDREIVNVIAKQFIVDGFDEINDPRGMLGVRLEMEGIIVTGSRTFLHNTLRCVERAGLDINDIVLQPLASGEIALSDDEKNLGTVLVDIGGGSTTISFYKDGHIKHTTVLPVGGDHITKDLSIGLRTSTEEAEHIKTKHGHAFYDLASEEEVFSVPIIGSDQHDQFNQLEISEIIEARLEELFMMIVEELRQSGITDVAGGYVLTGGTSAMNGILDLAQDVFQNRVRVAIPDYIGVREPQFTTAVGLIKYAYKNARLTGRKVGEPLDTQPKEIEERRERQEQKQDTKPSKKENEKQKDGVGSKMKRLFGYFFEE
ncbi:cell division protein FtsA [Domibacillus epiphyticus]|uniref:Cell division protein FtsA n=1 Tax=Domibacillus epiphyticus TaxID=1714355 RepID=A0A1V2ACK2_9BACI|nr:cell division protein FtsA [Domibacillus epiphyticus]OMP68524.1 cell division protein FtsA [Domibacillus epiphyticus]